MVSVPDIVERLTAAVGADCILIGMCVEQRYHADWSAVDAAVPLAVVQPRNTSEVAEILRICHALGQPVVPQGGLTGLAGGATPRSCDLVLSLERLTGIEELDVPAATMTVRAGTPLEVIQQAAAEAGFLFGVDLGSRGTCQIGGNISTNAGGNRVIRYGMMREQVLGLEAVLADGTVVSSLSKVMKNNTGYDLKQLFIGSEGTLGVITRAVLRLHPRPQSLVTALTALTTYDHCVALLRRAQAETSNVTSFEVMWGGFYDFIVDQTPVAHKPLEVGHSFYALIEINGHDPTPDRERLEFMLEGAMADGLISDAVVANSERQAAEFWRIREGEAIDRFPLVINFDVSIPITDIGTFAQRCNAVLDIAFPHAIKLFYGHIGDSNVHIAIMMDRPVDDAAKHTIMQQADAVVYEATREMHGAISAEHGVGTLKRRWLGYSRSPSELMLMRILKQSLDPKGILNPGKVL